MGVAQNFTVKFISTDNNNPTPIKGALAWVYNPDGKTIKKIVESNSEGVAEFGVQPAHFSFGYTDRSISGSNGFSITTIENMPNTGSFVYNSKITSCEHYIPININISNVPADVFEVSLSHAAVERTVNFDKNTHSAIMSVNICQDLVAKDGVSQIPVIGRKQPETIANSQEVFYYGILDIKSLVKDQTYTVVMDKISSQYTWASTGFTSQVPPTFGAYISYDLTSEDTALSPVIALGEKPTGVYQYANLAAPTIKNTGRMNFVAYSQNKSCLRSSPLKPLTPHYETIFAPLDISNIAYNAVTNTISWQNSSSVALTEIDIKLKEIGKNQAIDWTLTLNGQSENIALPDLPGLVMEQIDVQKDEKIEITGVNIPNFSYEKMVIASGRAEVDAAAQLETSNAATLCLFNSEAPQSVGSSTTSSTSTSTSSSGSSSTGNSSNSSNSSSSGSSGSGSSSASSSSGAPTYWGQVAPILFKNCTSCHSAGGIAPFTLTNYSQAKNFAQLAAITMRNRTMPPWPMTGDGSCGEHQDSRWMSETDIKTVEAWVAAGTPEGAPRTDLASTPPAKLSGGTEFNTPRFTPARQGGALAHYDEYRCFNVPTTLTKDQFITGYEVTPGNKAMIHHVLVYTVDPFAQSDTPLSNASQIQKLDAESPDRDGWPCFGSAGEGIAAKGVPVSWAPGQGATYFPENTGFRIKASDQLIVQVHYNLADEVLIGQTDQTHIGLALKDTVAREGFFILHDPLLGSLGNDPPDTIPAGQNAYEYTWTLSLSSLLDASSNQKIDFYGSLPHMHERGTQFSSQIVHADGKTECTADIKQWDFDWQLYYFYKKPFTLSASDVIKTTCTYDTTGDTNAISPGWGTQNEMCLYGMFLVPQ